MIHILYTHISMSGVMGINTVQQPTTDLNHSKGCTPREKEIPSGT